MTDSYSGDHDSSSAHRLLVLGGSGFLGRHVLAAACEGGPREVISAGRKAHDLPGDGGVHSQQVDAADSEALAELLHRLRPDAIINCAALANPARCESEPEEAARLNTRMPRELAEWCAGNDARLVHISTDLVFGRGPAPKEGFSESDSPAPVSIYGESKQAGEVAVLEANPNALIVRLPLMVGDSFGRRKGASDPLLHDLAQGQRPRLFTDEWRSPLEVQNAACALLELLDSRHSGLLHLGGPQRLSRHELGLRILAAQGHSAAEAALLVEPTTRAELDLSPPRPEDCSLDSGRARELLRTELLPVHLALAASARPRA